jgi:hypothetical protein
LAHLSKGSFMPFFIEARMPGIERR